MSPLSANPSLSRFSLLDQDITYDVELVPSLVSVIRRLLYAKKSCAAYIAAMPRNPATLDAFVAQVEAKGMEIRLLTLPKLTVILNSFDFSQIARLALTSCVLNDSRLPYPDACLRCTS